jgi:hypothetical protein
MEAELDFFVIRELEPKRLYSFAIGREHNEVALVQSQLLNPDWLFVRP